MQDSTIYSGKDWSTSSLAFAWAFDTIEKITFVLGSSQKVDGERRAKFDDMVDKLKSYISQGLSENSEALLKLGEASFNDDLIDSISDLKELEDSDVIVHKLNEIKETVKILEV